MPVACRHIEKTVFLLLLPVATRGLIIPASGNVNFLIKEIKLLLVDDRILTDTVDVDDAITEVDDDKPRHVGLDGKRATDIHQAFREIVKFTIYIYNVRDSRQKKSVFPAFGR